MMNKCDADNIPHIDQIIQEKVNTIIVARDNEMKAVEKQFDRVLEGGMGLTVVTGNSGNTTKIHLRLSQK